VLAAPGWSAVVRTSFNTKVIGAALAACLALPAPIWAQDSQTPLDLLFAGRTQIEPEVLTPLPQIEPDVIMLEPDVPVPAKKKKRIAKRPKMIDPQAALEGRGSIREADGGGQPDIEPRVPKTVAFPSNERSGTIVIDTAGRQLFYVKDSQTAYRYRIAVGKTGFNWAGSSRVSQVTQWPDWRPPDEMRERKPELPELMTGGVRNPLGARAIYLGSSLYRIHGTNEPRSIGRAASSGCFRMHNRDVVHLASIVDIGARVIVLDKLPKNTRALKVKNRPAMADSEPAAKKMPKAKAGKQAGRKVAAR
jgi:lipoprotein-anchoring transpeptidase ErfK/SrfK